MTRTRKKTAAFVVAAGTALGLSVATSWGAVIYSQDFESSTAASEYASGDFNPAAPSVGTQANIVEPGSVSLVQVVNASTDPGSAGAPQVKGTNSLRINSHAGGGNCCPKIEISTADVTSATLVFSVYGDPGVNRLIEHWTLPWGSNELRLDSDGSIWYDSNGGWSLYGDATFAHNQWNDVNIATFVDGVNPPTAYVTINGSILGDDGAGGGFNFARTGGAPNAINKHIIAGQTGSGEGAAFFLDNIQVHDVFDTTLLPVPEEPPAVYVVESAIHTAIEVTWPTSEGAVYRVQYANELTSTNDWENLGALVSGDGETARVFDSVTEITGRIYRVVTY